MILGVVREGTGAPSGRRDFLAANQRLFRCDTPRRPREIQRGRGHTRRFAHMQEQPSKVGHETALESMRQAIGGMLCADDACIVSRSPRGLEQMIAIVVEGFGAFGLIILERKAEAMCMLIPRLCTGLIP